ncbi:MAG: TetR/AcrR family transcriptional regulator [Planctomycetes bacterium]|jgi:AcrR family transcriptional regulator|nr:TetR/AcrR family transcriptional regulator [Planctomycetota bacterium]
MKLSSPKRDLRQRQLLDAALRVFARDGFDGASVASIADEAGVAKGSVYLYFDSKESLAGELVRDVFTHNDAEIEPSMEPKPLERLFRFCANQEARVLSLGEFAAIVLHMWGHAGKRGNDLIARGIRQVASEALFLIETLIERARVLGELPRETDCRLAARAALALCYGLIQQRVTFERNEGQQLVHCEDALRIYFRGMGAKV